MYVVHVVQGAHMRRPHASSTHKPVQAQRPESICKLHSAVLPKVIYVPPSPSDGQASYLATNEAILVGGNSINRPLPATVQHRGAYNGKLRLGQLATALKHLIRLPQNNRHLLLANARIRQHSRQRSHTPAQAVSCGGPLAVHKVIQLPAGYSSPQRSRQARPLLDDILAGLDFVRRNPAAAAPAHSDDFAGRQRLQSIEQHQHRRVIGAISIHNQATATAAMSAVLVAWHRDNKQLLNGGWKQAQPPSHTAATPASHGATGPDVACSDSWLNSSASAGALVDSPALKASPTAGGAGAGSVTPAAACCTSSSTSGSGQAAGKESSVVWGTPIGGTLFVNPDCQPSVAEQPDASSMACSAGHSSVAARAAPAAADGTSFNGSDNQQYHGERESRQPLPESAAQTPAASTASSSQVAASVFCPSLGEVAAHPGRPVLMGGYSGSPPVAHHAAGGLSSGFPGVSATSAVGDRAANAAAAAAKAAIDVPTASLGFLKLGVLLMGAAATVALSALYYSQRSSARPSAIAPATETSMATAAPPCADTSKVGSSGAAGAAVEDSSHASLPGFHEWMVARLGSTLKQFEAERSLLSAELSVLKALERNQQQTGGAARAAAVAEGIWGSVKGFFVTIGAQRVAGTQSGRGRKDSAVPAAKPGSAGDGAIARDQDLSPAGISARISQIQEQLESLDVLKAALTTELTEQQQQQQQAAKRNSGVA